MTGLLAVAGLGLATLFAGAITGAVVEKVTGSQDKGVLAFVLTYLFLVVIAASVI